MPPLARTLVRLALLAAAFALATWAFGWWTVPALAAAWGAVRARGAPAPGGAPMNRSPAEAGLAALLAWAALLAMAAARGPAGALAGRLAGVMRIPAPALVVVTLVFPAALAWSAATAARALAALPGRAARRAA
jgi:hypothetical protein